MEAARWGCDHHPFARNGHERPETADRHLEELVERSNPPRLAWGQQRPGALLMLSMEGYGCRVDRGVSAPPRFAVCREPYPDLQWQPPAFEQAMIEPAERLIRGYGPVTEADLRYWLGAAAAESRAVM